MQSLDETSPSTRVKLSNGLSLPKGTFVATGHPYAPGSKTQSTLFTTEKSHSLDTFYPWRYSEIRSIPGQEINHQFVTSSAESSSFGFRPHACPRRFFASNEIKVVLVELLKRYDVGLGPNGEPAGVAGLKGPEGIKIGFIEALNPASKVYIRDRRN